MMQNKTPNWTTIGNSPSESPTLATLSGPACIPRGGSLIRALPPGYAGYTPRKPGATRCEPALNRVQPGADWTQLVLTRVRAHARDMVLFPDGPSSAARLGVGR